MNHYLKLLVIGIIAGLGLLVAWPAAASMTEDAIVICHHTPGHEVTLSFHNEQSYLGHLGTPHNDETFDSAGACQPPEETPTEEPTVSPTLTVTPTAGASATPEPPFVGDGHGDGRSDGRSSCPVCTQAPQVPKGAPATGHGAN